MNGDTTIPLPGLKDLRFQASPTWPMLYDLVNADGCPLSEGEARAFAAAMNAAQATVPPSRGDGATHPDAAGQPVSGSGGVDDETGYMAKAVAEQVKGNESGFWRACSGCQESSDGYVSEKLYPYSRIFMCQPGCGCSECGGIGVVWDNADYSALGEALAKEAAAPTLPATASSGDFEQACKPWEFSTGPVPEWDSPLHGVFVAGMLHAEKLLCDLLDVKTYQPGDGSEDFDQDATTSLRNILAEARIWDLDEATFAKLPATASGGAAVAVSVGDAEWLILLLVQAEQRRCEAYRVFHEASDDTSPELLDILRNRKDETLAARDKAHSAVVAAIRSLAAQQDKDGVRVVVQALEAMLQHSCVADASADDKFPEDHEAERMARRVLRALKTAATADQPGREGEGSWPAEDRAREIYEGWKDQPGWVPWVEHGNSDKQWEARMQARREASPAPRQDGEQEAWK